MVDASKYVGVISPWDLIFTSLKREALFFDTIAIPNISESLANNGLLHLCPIRSLEFLLNNEIVIDPVKDLLGKEKYLRRIGKDVLDERLKAIEDRKRYLLDELAALPEPVYEPKRGIEGLVQFLSIDWRSFFRRETINFELGLVEPIKKFGALTDLFARKMDYDRRGIACDLRENYGINAFPASGSSVVINDEFISGKNEIIQIVLEKLPEPDFESEPWEKIIDFRNDPIVKTDLLALRNWCNEIAKGQLTGFEIAEKIDYLLHEYEQHISLHKMKTSSCSLETLLMIPAQILEGFFKLKPTKAIKGVFAFKHRKVELREAELKAPGRELAYILRSCKEFRQVRKSKSDS